MPATLKLTVEKGEDVVFTGTHQIPPGVYPSGPVDISGYTILVTIRTVAGTVFLTKAGTITSAANGTYTWPLADEDTSSADAGIYNIDIWRTNSGSQRLMAEGQLVISANTRNP